MKPSLPVKQWDIAITVIVLLFAGCVLAVVRLLLSVLPLNNVLELLVYGGFGYIFGRKVFRGSPWWGLLLALPALLLVVYRIHTAGTSIGIEPILTLLLLPLAAGLGIYLRMRYQQRHALIDDHFLDD